MRSCFHAFSCAWLLLFGALAPSLGADDKDAPRFEVDAGADYGVRAAGLFDTVIWSPFGPVTQPGFRLKLDGFGSVYGDNNAGVFATGFLASDLKMLGALMGGYQFHWDSLWLKLYAGAAYQAQTKVTWQALSAKQEQGVGAKIATESWWRLGERTWATANLSWLQLHNASSLYSSAGYDVYRSGDHFKLAAGAELGASVSDINFAKSRLAPQYQDSIRGGALVKLTYGSHELDLSGGVSQTGVETIVRPYATLTYGRKF